MKHAEWEYFQQMAVSRPVTQANPIMYDGKAAPRQGKCAIEKLGRGNAR